MGNNIGGNNQDLHQVRKGALSAKQTFFIYAKEIFNRVQQKNTIITIKT